MRRLFSVLSVTLFVTAAIKVYSLPALTKLSPKFEMNLARITTSSTEKDIREAIKARVQRLRLERNFEELEKIAASYRLEKTRTPSGLWALTHFYHAMGPARPKPGARMEALRLRGLWADAGEEWIAEYPKSPAAHIARAEDLLADAWDSWEYDRSAFDAKLREAALLLENSYSFAKVDPHWYKVRMAVASARREWLPKYLFWFTDSIQNHPNYLGNFFEMGDKLGSGLLPLVFPSQWFISWFEWILGDEAAPELFARLNWYLMNRRSHVANKLGDTKVFWPRLKRSIEALVKRYPVQHNVIHFLRHACEARNEDAVRWLQEQAKVLAGPKASSIEIMAPESFCGWPSRFEGGELKMRKPPWPKFWRAATH